MYAKDYAYVRSRSKQLGAFGDPILAAVMQLIPAAGQAISGGVRQAITPPAVETEEIIQNYNPPPSPSSSPFSIRNLALAGGAVILLTGLISFARK